MVSERLTTLFGKVKDRREDIARFVAKEVVGAIPFIGQIIKDAIDEFSPDEKEELIKELKELSESQFKEISEKVGVSVEYLEGIQKFTLYYFKELRADHEEIKGLLLHLIEVQTREVEVKLPEIDIPTIQSVLRKGETFEGDFFKKEPEWIDFEEGFVVERREVDEIIKKLENDNIQPVFGEPASGKSVILKNIGFKLAKENKDVYIVELKKHSGDEVKRYFDDIPEIKNEKAVFIVDDAHLLPTECERLVREFKNRKSKAKLIIGSRSNRLIQGGHPKEVSEFEYLSEKDIRAEDVTEEMIKTFLERKYGFSDERIKGVSKNLEKYKKDLWHLSWAVKTHNPKKDSVEDKEIYEKVKDSIRNISAGKDKPRINAEDIFLPLSVFYRFEIPIERDFLEEQLEIEEDKINQLVELSEIIETEKMGRNRMLSLIHSSIADLYFKVYQAYPSLGNRIKKKILNQKEENLQYYLFYKYMTSTNPRNAIDIVDRLERRIYLGWLSEKGEVTLFKKIIGDEKVEKSIKEGIEKEEDMEKIGRCVWDIAYASKEVALKLVDSVSSKIEKEENIEKIGRCVGDIAEASKEVALKLVDSVSSKIEKEENIEKIGRCVWYIAYASKEVARKIVNRITIDTLSSKIEQEKDIRKIGRCVWSIAEASKEVGLKLANHITIDTLSSKIEQEKDIREIGWCVGSIAKASKEVGLKLANHINIDTVSLKMEKEGDVEKIGWCVRSIVEASKEVAREIVNCNIDTLLSKVEKEEDITKIGWCVGDIAEASKEVAQEIVNHLIPKIREELQKGG
jgi:hypothetical protein